jgi:light-harvesting complex II chlorophyll a/b binding protein 4
LPPPQLDELDQNAAVNKAGSVLGAFTPVADQVSSDTPLAPYSEVFGLQRFRENELIHGRWAMLACLGALVQEAVTGDSWVAAQVGTPLAQAMRSRVQPVP